MLPVSEKVIVLNLIRKEKISYDKVATTYSKNKSTREIVKKKKEIHVSFATVTSRTANLWPQSMVSA